MILWLRRWTFQAARRCRRARRRTMTPAVSVSVMALDGSRLIKFSRRRRAAYHPASSPYMTRHNQMYTVCILPPSSGLGCPLFINGLLRGFILFIFASIVHYHSNFLQCCAHTFLITRICTYIRYTHAMQKKVIRSQRRGSSSSPRVVTSNRDDLPCFGIRGDEITDLPN